MTVDESIKCISSMAVVPHRPGPARAHCHRRSGQRCWSHRRTARRWGWLERAQAGSFPPKRTQRSQCRQKASWWCYTAGGSRWWHSGHRTWLPAGETLPCPGRSRNSTIVDTASKGDGFIPRYWVGQCFWRNDGGAEDVQDERLHRKKYMGVWRRE